MIGVRAASPAETVRWHARWRIRMRRWYGQHGVPQWADGRLAGWRQADETALFILTDPAAVGHLALAVHTDEEAAAGLHDLWVEPPFRGRGYGHTARAFAEDWARRRAGVLGVRRWSADPAAEALFASYPLRHQKMVKRLEPGDRSLPAGLVVRPIALTEFPEWLANDIDGYAADLTNSGTLGPDDAARAAARSYAELVPQALSSPGLAWHMLDTADGANVAALLLGYDQPGECWVYSVEVRPQHRGRGYGRAAMLVAEQQALAAGIPLVALNVFGHNHAAIGLYASLGYAVVDATRSIALDRPTLEPPGLGTPVR